MTAKTLIIAGILCFAFNSRLPAHGDLSEQIERISKRIEKDSTNAKLYLKRGQLHAQHKDFKEAKQDYYKARKLNKEFFVTDLLLAQLYAENNLPDTALIHANAYLKHHPTHPNALITRAGIYQHLGEFDLCQKDLENAIANIKAPNPGHFVSISKAVLLKDSSNVAEAVEWLKKGEEEFGFDIVLKTKEAELYVQSKQYENAILTIDNIIEQFPRKEKWLYEKAMIYEKMGNIDLAKKEYEATLTAIQKLPKRLQKTSKMLQLEAQTYIKLEDLSK